MTTGLPLLNMVIGFAAVFAAFSLVASWIQELFAGILSLRSKNLIKGIESMMDDPANAAVVATLKNQLMQQPSIAATVNSAGRNPSYLSAHQFSLAINGVLNAGQQIATTANQAVGQVIAGINALPQSRLKSALSHIADQAAGEYGAFIAGVEQWYDEEMDRVSGWYHRNAQIFLACFSIALAVGFNLDAVRMLRSFQSAPIVVSSEKLTNTQAGQNYVLGTVLQYPCIGWGPQATPENAAAGAATATSCPAQDSPPVHALGIIISAIALMLGAPFWFDTLSRFVNVRNAGPKAKNSQSA